MANLNINKYTRNQWRQQAPNSVNNFADMDKNFELLNEKLAYAQKELNAWDFYKIATTIASDSEYQLKLSTLLPNTAAIVTSKIDAASVGDIFFKDSSYNINYIGAERGGIFYPKRISEVIESDQVVGYIMSFSFLNREPELDDPENPNNVTVNADVEKVTQTINFTGISPVENIASYAETVTAAQHWTSTCTILENIKPVIKAFTVDNEEVYSDLQWTITNDHFVFSQIPSIIAYIVIK